MGLASGWITVARLGRPRGRIGELTATPYSFRADRLGQGDPVYLLDPVTAEEMADRGLPRGVAHRVERSWLHQGRLILKFFGVDTMEAAEQLRGWDVLARRRLVAPPEGGEADPLDLVDFLVMDRQSGARLGVVRGWQATGGPPLLEVEGLDKEELLIPFVPAICRETDWERGRILVDLPEGLKDLNRE